MTQKDTGTNALKTGGKNGLCDKSVNSNALYAIKIADHWIEKMRS